MSRMPWWNDADEAFDDIAGHLNALHGRMVDTARWLLDHPAEWQGDGVWTPEAYIAWRSGVARSTAAKIVDVARRCEELPSTVDALRRGELSLDQVVPIARHAPAWADAQMARLAPELMVNQISKIARGYTWEIDEPVADDSPPDDDGSDETAEADVDVDDRAWYGWGDDGRFRLHLEVGADTGSLISTALDECHDQLFHDRTDTAVVSTIDAVVEMAQRSVNAIPSESRRNRARVNVFVDAENGAFSDNRGRPMPTAPAQRITCDALLSRIDVVDGIPVSVGRSQHIVPDRTRRIVEHRDGGCRVPGCGSERVVEVHHIVHWSQGGPTDTANLICLCPKHHRLHHHGELGIDGDADRPAGTAGAVSFHDRRGRPIRPSGASPNQPTGPPPDFDGTWHHPANERIDHRYLNFHELA